MERVAVEAAPLSRHSGAPELDALVTAIGREAYELIEKLFPFCRSLTGEGVRRTLRALQSVVPLEIHEVPSGTRAYDWVVPDEWNIEDAYVLDGRGRRIIDFRANNLHVVGYSSQIDRRVPRSELLQHLFTDPAHPDWIPYRHTYYKESWGFCAPHALLASLTETEYRVRIDSRRAPGSLTYGEFLLPGTEPGEILISTHTCHPSLCNDNLSGIAVASLLARELQHRPRRLAVRFVFVPATLGPLVWLSRNEHLLASIRGGLVLAGIGDSGPPTYTRSRRGISPIDRAMTHVLEHSSSAAQIRDFAPTGYDQRQYCSPGFDLPIGGLNRTPNGEYPEYHTSADNLQCVSAAALGDSWRIVMQGVDILQHDRRFLNQSPKGEPQLGPRGLYEAAESYGLRWILNFSDGRHSLLDIADRARIPFWRLQEGARRLLASGLLQDARPERLWRPVTNDVDEDDWRGAVALVTGGPGFIGGALCARLARAGVEVHSVSRRESGPASAKRHWRADLSDEAATLDLVRELHPDYVFHLASHVMGAPDLKHVLPAFHSNLQTTVNLLCALAQVRCRRVITTGSLVEPDPGGDDQVPNSPYAAAKWASADYTRMFHALYELPVAIARVFMVYGPGQDDETKLVPYTIRCIERGEAPRITSGNREIDWIFVSDVVEGFLKLASSKLRGSTVDLGSGSAITITTLVDTICELMDTPIRPQYGALPDRPLEPLRVARTQESLRLIGWSPKVDLREGLQQTIHWYRTHSRKKANA